MRYKTAFTLIELLVVVAIITTLIAILVPSLNRAVTRATEVVCSTNLRANALGMITYAADYQLWYPFRDLPNPQNSQIIYWSDPKYNYKMHEVISKYIAPGPTYQCPFLPDSWENVWPILSTSDPDIRGRAQWNGYHIYVSWMNWETFYQPDGTAVGNFENAYKVVPTRVSAPTSQGRPLVADGADYNPTTLRWSGTQHVFPEPHGSPLVASSVISHNAAYGDGSATNYTSPDDLSVLSVGTLRERMWAPQR